MWGLNADGAFCRSSLTAPALRFPHQVEDRSDLLLARFIQGNRELTKEEIFYLQDDAVKKATVAEHIRRMLYVLQKDLLGSHIAGRILEVKSQRERFHCDSAMFPAYNFQLTEKIGPLRKLCVLMFLIGTMLGMIGYIANFSAQYPSQLQRAWLYTLLTWCAFDAVFISTLEVMFHHVWLPYYIKSDLKIVINILADLIAKYTVKVQHDNEVRTAATEPALVIQNSSSKQKLVPDEVPEEKQIFNISDFFFVSARIAEHKHETAQARFVLSLNTMLPPGAPFPLHAWYRTLDWSLQNAAIMYKNPLRAQGGFRTILRLDLHNTLLKKLLVMFIYLPLWTQDFLVQLLLVGSVGVFFIIMFELYAVDPVLAALPPILLAVAAVVMQSLTWINKMFRYLCGPSNRIRPQLPTTSLDVAEAEVGPVSKRHSKHRSKNSSKNNSSNNSSNDLNLGLDEPDPGANDEEIATNGSARRSNNNNSLSNTPREVTQTATEPVVMETLLADPALRGPLSPEREPKHLPQQGSPFPRSAPAHFPEDSESDEELETSKIRGKKQKGLPAEPPSKSLLPNKQDEQSIGSGEGGHIEAEENQEEEEDGPDAHMGGPKVLLGGFVIPARIHSDSNSEYSDAIAHPEEEKEQQISPREEIEPGTLRQLLVARSLSDDLSQGPDLHALTSESLDEVTQPNLIAKRSFSDRFVGMHADEIRPAFADGKAPNKPSIKVQNLVVSPTHRGGPRAAAKAEPAPLPHSTTEHVARSVESEQEDSDFDEADSDLGSRESIDEPNELLD